MCNSEHCVLQRANSRGSMFPTIMLTGLPEGEYKHEEVAKLVWPYFPKQTLHSLYYNVIVLSLQRRAFVHFSDWTSCCSFVQNHIWNPLSVRGCALKIHFVLEYMYPESKEELMYKSLMKWSNARVPDPESLEERLLCVEISETSVDVVKSVMKAVVSIAKFVSFLPLANRICVEMADSSGVTQVVEKYNSLLSSSAWQGQNRSQVQRVESVKSLKQRLEHSSEITLNLDLDTISAEAQPPTQPPTSKPSVQTTTPASAKPAACDESVSCEDVAAESSSAAAGDLTIEDGEKLETEIVVDSACPQSNEEKVVKKEEGSPTTIDDTASGATHTNLVSSDESTTELLQIDQDTFGAKEGQEDFSDDVLASDAYIFDEPDFNMSDFVTVDEIADDGEEMNPDPHSPSSSKQSCTGIKVEQSSGTPSAPKQTSTRFSTRSSTRSSTTSLKDSKSSASSSSKSTKDYVKRRLSSTSTSLSPKTSKDSSKPSKSPASSSSSFLSLETSSSSGQKAQQSKTKSPLKGLRTSFSSCRMGSSSTAHEMVKMLSAAVSVERLPVSQRKAAKESVVAKSDHKVSAEGTAAKTVEKIEKLNQDQNVETDLKDTTLKDLEKGIKRKIKKEEDVDSESDQMQRDEGNRAGSSDTKPPETENSSVSDDGKSCPEKCSEKELDSVTKNKPGNKESELVEDDGPTVKHLSEEDVIQGDNKSESESKEANNDVRVQVLDTARKGASMDKGVTKKRKRNEEEESTSAESCNSSKQVEKPDDQIPKDEDQAPKVSDNKDSEVTEEIFEILDSTDDQTAMDLDGQNIEALRDQMSKDKEEDASKVVDSVEDQPTTTQSDNKEKKTAKPHVTSRRDETSSKRSGLRTRASKSEEKVKSPEKQDRMVKTSETPRDTTAKRLKKDQDTEEEKVYEIVDSIEGELVQDAAATEKTDRRRSGRGKKEDKMTLNLTEASEKEDEEASYEILDSVEDETPPEEPVIMRRSTRGRRERMTKKDQTKKEDTPTRRRRTPARESQEKTPKKEEKASSTKESDIPVREEIDEDATYEILDSVEDKVLKDDPPTTGGKGKRGRPKKAVKSTTKDIVTLKGDKDASEKEADEEKVSYQILDAVEDEMVDDGPPPEESAKNKEEEPVYQIVDSVEDDQVQEELTTEVSEGGTKETSKTKVETHPKEEEAAVTETPTFRIIVEASEKVVTKDLDHEPSAGLEKRERSSKASIKKERASTTKSQNDPTTPEVEKNQKPSGESDTTALMSALVNLDEVSDEEEDYPDNIAEEEELRERKGAAKEKELTREEVKKEKVRERKEEVEVDAKELVTLDEVEADESGEEVAQMRQETNGEIPAKELQGLVTLDQIVEEVEETVEARPPIKDDQSVDSAPQTSETLDEVGDDKKEKMDQVMQTSRPAKVVSKKKNEIVEPEAKRSRFQSPSVPADFKLPPFRANQPLGQEFVVPKSGYFCNICRVFYLNESSAKDVHCSSQMHYNNLQKHYQKLQQKLSRSSTPNSQGFICD